MKLPFPLPLLAVLPLALSAVSPSTAHATPPPAAARDVVALRFASDPPAQTLALSLFDADADVVDALPAELMDGGYRGTIRLVPSFKCGPEENGRAWQAIAAEFFGGVDLVPGC